MGDILNTLYIEAIEQRNGLNDVKEECLNRLERAYQKRQKWIEEDFVIASYIARGLDAKPGSVAHNLATSLLRAAKDGMMERSDDDDEQ